MRFNGMMIACLFLSVVLSEAVSAEADEEVRKERTATLRKVWNQLETDDSWQAAALVQSTGEPPQIARRYSNLVRDLYGAKRDVPRMILIGQAGIRFCLEKAAVATKAGDNRQATELKGLAKEIAYNLSVNCWPAWEDQGIAITRSDQRIALDAARLNLRLAKELKRSDDKLAAAHWLRGAHDLALGNQDQAIEDFLQAAKLYNGSAQPDGKHMCLGYVAIAQLEKNRNDDQANTQLNNAVAALKHLGTDDAKFYADQLFSVNKFFARRSDGK